MVTILTSFNPEKLYYISYSSSLFSNSYHVYANPNMEKINPSDNVLGLGIYMTLSAPVSSTPTTFVFKKYIL